MRALCKNVRRNARIARKRNATKSALYMHAVASCASSASGSKVENAPKTVGRRSLRGGMSRFLCDSWALIWHRSTSRALAIERETVSQLGGCCCWFVAAVGARVTVSVMDETRSAWVSDHVFAEWWTLPQTTVRRAVDIVADGEHVVADYQRQIQRLLRPQGRARKVSLPPLPSALTRLLRQGLMTEKATGKMRMLLRMLTLTILKACFSLPTRT